jgi:hypothetical protein
MTVVQLHGLYSAKWDQEIHISGVHVEIWKEMIIPYFMVLFWHSSRDKEMSIRTADYLAKILNEYLLVISQT